MKTITTLVSAAFIAASFAGAASAQFDWDFDDDGTMDMTEYGEYYEDMRDDRFEAYDTNLDGLIDAEEFDAAEFGRYDRDRDERLNADEMVTFEEDQGLFD
jgi:hypothetical protein